MQSWQLGSIGWGCTEPVVWTILGTTCGRCQAWLEIPVGLPMWVSRIEKKAFLFRCLDNKVTIRLRREATSTSPIFMDANWDSCESIINAAFNEWHPLHQRRRQFFNFQQSTSQDALEVRDLMKEADVDHMGQEDIACLMVQNCFLDTTLKAKLGVIKTP